MGIGNVVILIVSSLIALLGTVMVYDARRITRKLFSFGDQNDASMGLKMLGFIIAMIGALIFYFTIQ